MMASSCKTCGSTTVVPRKPYCRECYRAYQRKLWARGVRDGKAKYARHREKRLAESKERKAANRERYSLLEWFRRQGVSVESEHLDKLVEMKKALKEAKIKIDAEGKSE